MQPSKRAWVDIVADILTSSDGGEKITGIMYKTRLSYGHMKEYLRMLAESGLLMYVPENKGSYKTTAKGYEYLETYKRLRGMVFKKERDSSRRATGREFIHSVMPEAP